jgi:hypothetical protein
MMGVYVKEKKIIIIAALVGVPTNNLYISNLI